jgi:nicotinamidase-related amidase
MLQYAGEQQINLGVGKMQASKEKSAVLLIDLQRDFLEKDGRMPVESRGALAVIKAANAVLSGKILPESLPVLIVNQFSPSARMANFFRRKAAIVGSSGAAIDTRVRFYDTVPVFSKATASAFSNPALEDYLHQQEVKKIYAVGVFAEGCVRATMIDAMRRGFVVRVLEDAIASNAAWKKRFALYSMKHAGAELCSLTSLTDPKSENTSK